MQNFEEVEQCPHCHSHMDIKADITFLFSECCGYALCTPCVNYVFSKSETLKCPNCNETVNKRKYSKNRLSTQQFQNEASKRTQIHQACNLRRSDFKDNTEWNDYLEFVEDLVYDLAHGTADQRKRAEQTFKEWKFKNSSKIEKNKDLEYEEQMKIANNEGNADQDNDGDTEMAKSKQNVSVHPVFSHMTAAICIDRVDAPNVPSKISQEKLKKRRDKASGFTNKVSDLRDKSELISGLFFFHPPQSGNANK